ncbi:PREDICTED: isoamyl acetate-hydrolyzing esterase 1 homolog isoform X1 [Crocodylus porosus]|uniref:isoamyl acetate-hydrolyzing esterase 1 homolog isoform X1 n=1 Tax=Crocodylus porosus TaxID=8502 RepID=UPI000939372D|nr:PREDICTED: isoamyl acetate-hydrolyzing esterase 1 homolog isoform X1 [Crocodylus porosus]
MAEVGACRQLLSWPRVLLFGDSITELGSNCVHFIQAAFQENGWGASLAQKLVRKCDVLNRGLSGYNTRWAKLVLPRLISKSSNAENTVAVTIFFGANDSSLRDVNPKQHVPLEEYAENLKSLVQYLKSVDVTEDRIILITPPPLYEPAWEKECIAKGDKLNRLNSTTGEYAKTCVQVAKECGTDVIDLWTLMQRNKDFSSYLSDGLHLSAEGNNFLATQLWSWLENKISALPLLFPYWRDVDHLNPEGSLLGTPAH